MDANRHAHGDGIATIERILAKAATHSCQIKRSIQDICGKICPPVLPKKNSPSEKKTMDKEER